jgi:hypothetical protein
VTDDADVFLFGGQRVYRHMFNPNRHVEAYTATELASTLGVDRSALIRLAYLLGSDYTEGLPGIGGVWALEVGSCASPQLMHQPTHPCPCARVGMGAAQILREFPGPDGLRDFARWWRGVQQGQEAPSPASAGFRQRFVRCDPLIASIRTPSPSPPASRGGGRGLSRAGGEADQGQGQAVHSGRVSRCARGTGVHGPHGGHIVRAVCLWPARPRRPAKIWLPHARHARRFTHVAEWWWWRWWGRCCSVRL